MSDNSPFPDVSSDPIDVYLDAVERAMTAARAPRTDRLQVLQDLEAQIADMLARQPQPLTDEAVCAVIASLEPPNHFAENYGNDEEPVTADVRRSLSLPKRRWPMIAAFAGASFVLGYVLLLLAAAVGAHGPVIGFILLVLLNGASLTPFALWRSVKQLRSDPARLPDRKLVMRTAAIYAVVASTTILLLACFATNGYILIPIGLATCAYLEYMLIRRLWQRMNDTLPPQPTSTNGAPKERPTQPVNFSTAMSMPAM
jgi:hypothetical protein